jgi:hypothetical protein
MRFLKSCVLYLMEFKIRFMKKLLFSIVVISACSALQAQGLKGILSKSETGSTSAASGVFKKSSKTGLSAEEISAGLKEALRVGSEKAAAQVSSADGFF